MQFPSDLQSAPNIILETADSVVVCMQVSLTVLRGPVLDEVHQQINPWIYQVPYISLSNFPLKLSFLVLAAFLLT